MPRQTTTRVLALPNMVQLEWQMGGVDDIFDWIEGFLDDPDNDPSHIEVDYHETWGFPVSVLRDDPWAIDEEFGLTIWGFAPAGESLTLTYLPRVRPDDIKDPVSGLRGPQVRLAVRVALTDGTLQETLALQGFRLDRVSDPTTGDAGGHAVVLADLDRPVAPTHWPAEHCRGMTESRISWVRWTVDLEHETVLEVCGL